MKILMLNYEFPPIGGGASPVSYDIGKGLAQKGHQITVVTMAFKDLPKHEVREGMEIYRVSCLRTEKMVCHPWEQATYILSAIGFINKILKEQKFDVCYTHFIIPTGVVAKWCKEKWNLPYVITSHGSDVIGHNNKRFKLLYRLVRKPWCNIVKNAEYVISPSEYLKELMIKTEPQGCYKVIQNGIDTSLFTKGEKKEKRILVMCRLQETKNVQCIIKALAQVKLGEWQVDILGDGPYKETLMNLSKKYHLENKIRFQGWVENKSKEHLEILHKTSIFISASRVENCPTSILEVVACGARVLLSDIPAHRQLLKNVDSSIFFESDNDSLLASKLQILIENIEEIGSYTNTYEISQFDWKMGIEKYQNILNECREKKISI